MLVGIENLGENFKQLRSEVNAWGEPEIHMETEEDRIYGETQAALLQEVSLSFLHVENPGNPVVSTPISIPISVLAVELSGPSTSSLPESTNQDWKTD